MIEKTKKLNVVGQEEVTQIKLALVGDQGTGKSSFVQRYVNQNFKSFHEPTLGVETQNNYINSKNGSSIHLTLWDFSGKLDFADIRNQFYREAQIVLLFVDLSSKKTIDSIDYWVSEIKDNGGGNIFVVGNKKQNKKGNEAETKAKDKGCSYYEISCKSGEGIQDLIFKVISQSK